VLAASQHLLTTVQNERITHDTYKTSQILAANNPYNPTTIENPQPNPHNPNNPNNPTTTTETTSNSG